MNDTRAPTDAANVRTARSPADVDPTPEASRPMSLSSVSAKKLSDSLFVSCTNVDIGGDSTEAISFASEGAGSRAAAWPGEIPSAFSVFLNTPAANVAGFDW